MRKFVQSSLLTGLLAVVACGPETPVWRLPNGIEAKAHGYTCYDKPNCVYLEFENPQEVIPKAWIPGTITYVGPMPKTNPSIKNVTQVAVGGSGVLSGGSASNHFMDEDSILIKMRPNNSKLPEYVMQITNEYGDVSPRVLLSMYRAGDRIRVLPLRQQGDEYTLLNPVDIYSPRNIRR